MRNKNKEHPLVEKELRDLRESQLTNQFRLDNFEKFKTDEINESEYLELIKKSDNIPNELREFPM